MRKVAAAPLAPAPPAIPVAKETRFCWAIAEGRPVEPRWRTLTRQGGDFVLAPVDLRKGDSIYRLLDSRQAHRVGIGYRDPKKLCAFSDGRQQLRARVDRGWKKRQAVSSSLLGEARRANHDLNRGEPQERRSERRSRQTRPRRLGTCRRTPVGKFGFHIPAVMRSASLISA